MLCVTEGFGWKRCGVERFRVRLNVKRGMAPETAHGCTVGAKL
jgi:hypothetical protein